MGTFILDGRPQRLRKNRPALLVGQEGQIHIGQVSPRSQPKRLRPEEKGVEEGVFFDGVDWPVRDAIGGWPLLLSSGRPIEAVVNTGAAEDKRAPRTAVGYAPATQRMVWVVVDGRRRGYSLGATSAELTRYLASLGATEALSFDGGGSSTMWIEGAIVSRPSDLRGPRGVINALLLSRKPQREPR